MGPLAALAAAAGVAQGGASVISAQNWGQSERDLIKRAYQISKRRMNEAQAYTRQGTNESLNARGVLNGGADSPRSPVLSSAYADAAASAATNAKLAPQIKKGNVLGALKTLKAGGGEVQRQYGTEEARMAADAERGTTGAGGTISGQANSDLSREFYGEHQDLFSQRGQAISASKRGQAQSVAAGVASGIGTAAGVYNAGSMIAGAYGAQSPVPLPSAGQPGYTPVVKPGSWFGGYDPVDPLGMSKKTTNDLFNVNTK